jgi:hypothetical protein
MPSDMQDSATIERQPIGSRYKPYGWTVGLIAPILFSSGGEQLDVRLT